MPAGTVTTTAPKQRIRQINGKLFDFGTKNASFKKLAIELNKLGIKNFYFMLEVKDPRVINIDPSSPTITQEEVSIVLTELMRNPWYFLREVCRIPDVGGTSVGYLANRGNIAQAWCAIHGLDSHLNIPRQVGKTQSAIALNTWAYLFGTTNSSIIFFNKDQPAAKTNLDRMKAQIELLPSYMRLKMAVTEDGKVDKGRDSALTVRNPVNKNEVSIKGHANSQDKALNMARGASAPLIYYDETEFTDYMPVIIHNSAPVYVKSAEAAKKNGAPFWRIFTSTPGDLDTPAGRSMAPEIAAMPRWTDKIYDMSKDEIDEYIRKNGKNNSTILYIEYSYQQLNLGEEWFNSLASKIADPLTIKREVLLQRLRGSDSSPFTREQLDYLETHKKQPKFDIIIDNYRIDFYDEIDKFTPYLIGVDCSTGTMSDNNAMTIVNPYTLDVIGEFSCSYIGEVDFCKFIIKLICEHIPRGILCIERNSVGDAIINFLMHTKVANRLYYDRGKDLLEEELNSEQTVESMLKKQAKSKTFYGVYTEGTSRKRMFDILQRMVFEYKEKICTRNLVNDICGLIRKPNGRDEAGPGNHDDSVMSYNIAMYVYYHGDNLTRFGFEKGSRDIQNQNQGLEEPDSLEGLEQLVPPSVVEALKRDKEVAEMSYENEFAAALERARAETARLVSHNLIQSSGFSQEQVDEYEEINNESSISMDFFNELNGI